METGGEMDWPLKLRCCECHQIFVLTAGDADDLPFRCNICRTPVLIYDELDDDASDQ